MVIRDNIVKAKRTAEDFVVKTIQKYSYGSFGSTGYQTRREFQPIYDRTYSPRWIEAIARQQSLVNNSIEEKVNQAFRRGFDSWEKKYEAKCTECNEEFHSAKRFAKQLGQDPNEYEIDDIDFDTPRICPECGRRAEFKVPSDEMRKYAEKFFQRANERENSELIPDGMSSVSQTFIGVCRETGWDIQTFDDGWMIFEKSYQLDEEGSVQTWKPEGVYRAPAKRMRYSIDDDGKFGNEYWVCLECRSKDPETYEPQKEPGPCPECGNRTYEVFALMLNEPQGDPVQWFVKGEFAHDSEYRPTRLYGLSPIVSVADEAQTLDQMDDWYRMAYEERRAPRGAIVLNNQNTESVRAWTREQTDKLNNDPQHIPVFMGEGDSSSRPIEWISLLDEPAQMQHMQMREWFLDRVAAKFGVTQVFQSASAQATGMSQSLEIVVSNRSAERLQNVFEETFIPAFLAFLQVEGWERTLKPPEEEDEQAVEQMMGRRLQNVQTAQDLGLEVEWSKDDDYDIKPGTLGQEEEGEQEGEDGVDGLFGSSPTPDDSPPNSNPSDERVTTDEGVDSAGTTSTSGGRPQDAETTGGQPEQPDTPTSDEPLNRSDNSVTVDTGGYRNATYGGKPAEVIDMLQDLEDDDDDEDAEEKASRVNDLRSMYNETVGMTDDELPDYETIERSVLRRPDKGWNAFKRSNGGTWKTNYEAEQYVKQVYEFVQNRIHE